MNAPAPSTSKQPAHFPPSSGVHRGSARTIYGNPIDDAFAAGDALASQRKQEEDERKRQAAIYDSQVESVVRAYVDAVQRKAEEFNAHAKTTNKQP